HRRPLPSSISFPRNRLQRGGLPQEPNGMERDRPRARSNNAQPHHRLPGSHSFTGSPAPSNHDFGERPRPNFPACASVPKAGPHDSFEMSHSHFACHPKVGRRRHASSARPGQDPTGSDISEVEARAQALAEVIDQFLMPAIVANRYQEVLAANPIARALSPEFAPGKNFLRRRLLDRAAQELYVTWDEATASAVGGLRDLACP